MWGERRVGVRCIVWLDLLGPIVEVKILRSWAKCRWHLDHVEYFGTRPAKKAILQENPSAVTDLWDDLRHSEHLEPQPLAWRGECEFEMSVCSRHGGRDGLFCGKPSMSVEPAWIDMSGDGDSGYWGAAALASDDASILPRSIGCTMRSHNERQQQVARHKI